MWGAHGSLDGALLAADEDVLVEGGSNLVYFALGGSSSRVRELVTDVVEKLRLPRFSTLCIDAAAVREYKRKTKGNSNLSSFLESYQQWIELCATSPRKLLVFSDIATLTPQQLKQALHFLLKLGQDKGSTAAQFVAVVQLSTKGQELPELSGADASLTQKQAREIAANALRSLLHAHSVAEQKNGLEGADVGLFDDFNVDALFGRVSRIAILPQGSESTDPASTCEALGLADFITIGAHDIDGPQGFAQQCTLASAPAASIDDPYRRAFLQSFELISSSIASSYSAIASSSIPGFPRFDSANATLPTTTLAPLVLILLVLFFAALRLLRLLLRMMTTSRGSGSTVTKQTTSTKSAAPVTEDKPSSPRSAKGSGARREPHTSAKGKSPTSAASTASPASSASSSSSIHAGLSRVQLQALAKERGIKANLSSAEIVRLLDEGESENDSDGDD